MFENEVDKEQKLTSKDIRDVIISLMTWATNSRIYTNQFGRQGEGFDFAKSEYHRGATEAFERALAHVIAKSHDRIAEDKKKPYSRPKLTEYGDIMHMTRGANRGGRHHDGGHGRAHKT